jgi:hypothetical protein
MRLAFFALGLLGCASAQPTATVPTPLPAPLTAFDESPFWFGRSDHSPFGPMPYALMARRDGESLVLRGDVPDGLGLPPGAYQQFTFTPGPSTTLAFETSLTGEVVTGTMVEVAGTPESITFCLAPDKGGCDEMTVSLTRVAQGVLFETQRDKGPHHRVVLVATRP